MCKFNGCVFVQIGSISSFSVYAGMYAQTAKIKNILQGEETQKAEEALVQLEKTVEKVEKNTNSTSGKPAGGVSNLAWASLMYELGLTPTGDFTQDYNETITRLDELIKYTQNPNDLQRYLALADEVDDVFVAPLGSGASKTQSVMSGSEQIAQLNRVMMLNMGMK